MYEREWIALPEAAERLGESEERVRAIVSERRMDTSAGPDGGLRIDLQDVATYVELAVYDRAIDRGRTEAQAQREAERAREEWLHPSSPQAVVEGAHRASGSASEVPELEGPPAYPRIESNGNVMISLQEAREMLHVSTTRMGAILHQGRVNGFMKGRCKWVYLDEVEAYQRAQARWRELGGLWTIHGRLPKHKAGYRGELIPIREGTVQDEEADPPIESGPSLTAGIWITSREAADRLGISVVGVHALLRYGCLHGVLALDAPGPILRLRPPRRQVRRWFLLDEVLERADLVESRHCRAAWTPARWQHDLRHPVVRTELVAPPGDRLITTREAGAILGCGYRCLYALVRKGRLFMWQKWPGVKGVRAYYSERQVLRIANDAARLKSKAAYHAWHDGRAGERTGSGYTPYTPYTPYVNEAPQSSDACRQTAVTPWGKVLRTPRADEPSRWDGHDFGDFLTTRQAAIALGVAVSRIGLLRESGRLTGYRRPKRSWQGAGHNWWFYRKADVYALAADPEYACRHRRQKEALARTRG